MGLVLAPCSPKWEIWSFHLTVCLWISSNGDVWWQNWGKDITNIILTVYSAEIFISTILIKKNKSKHLRFWRFQRILRSLIRYYAALKTGVRTVAAAPLFFFKCFGKWLENLFVKKKYISVLVSEARLEIRRWL